ncbi:MAG TPA: glucose-6-phosphate isomerase [bacterium]|nr:glucose-6-phosphate isomerase [bacterium]
MAAKKNVVGGIKLDYTNMMSDAVGAKDGLTANQLKSGEKQAAGAFASVSAQRKAGKLPFMDLPYTMSAGPIEKYAAGARRKFENLVVLGIGGSALGMTALQTALNPAHYNLLDASKRRAPRLFVEDNVDPERIAAMLDLLDPKKTLFNVITKSGGTAETMSALMIARDMIVKKLGKSALKEHLVATTDIKQGNLRAIVDREGLSSFVVPDGVGGRFSVLTAVGLLPAAIVGIDIRGLLSGAAAMDKRCSSGSISSNPALAGAVLHFLMDTAKGKNIQVMMPYANALGGVADWFAQLWAESLGKKHSTDGRTVCAGQTPVKAIGATDQHSQLQLYMEGPADKAVTFMRVEKFRRTVKIPKVYADMPGLAYLAGRGMDELLNAEQKATELALAAARRPNCSIILPEINAGSVGQLLYMLEIQTAYAGALYGVNAFDQPGVESGKVSTYALMGRPGYEKQRAEIEKAAKAMKRRVV